MKAFARDSWFENQVVYGLVRNIFYTTFKNNETPLKYVTIEL